jgi:ribosomal protein S18 acetylase RimI-like enzyme
MNPDYAGGWRRPNPDTAARVWSLIAEPLGIKLDALLPGRQVCDALTVSEYTAAVQDAKAAFVVAYDAAVSAAERKSMLTTNLVFDALAARWSDTYQHVRATTPATCSWDMRTETIHASWRDLQRNAIQLGALYRVLHGGADSKSQVDRGVYSATRAGTRGYSVTVTDPVALAEYLAALARDPNYRPRRHGRRLLLAEDQAAPARHACDVAAERPYNAAAPGPKSVEIIQQLEAARVSVHVPTVLEEIAEMEAAVANLANELQRDYGVDVATLPRPRPRSPEAIAPGRVQRLWRLRRRLRAVPTEQLAAAKALLVRYDRARAQLDSVAGVRDRLRALAVGRVPEDGHVTIRSRFRKELNRRYQAVDFWPAEITGKAFQRDLFAEAEPVRTVIDADGRRSTRFSNSAALYTVTSRRARWFFVPATGLEALYAGYDDDWTGESRPLAGVDVRRRRCRSLRCSLVSRILKLTFGPIPSRTGSSAA